jgi:hypothetical protein
LTADTGTGSVLNQWWAIVLFDDATPGHYGVYVFEVSGQTAQTNPVEFYPVAFDVGAFTTVPEPTSVALLALGAAAIGLRRRFRK